MNIQSTNTSFPPELFKQLNRCIYCSKARIEIVRGGQCETCDNDERPKNKCEVCGIILRNGEYTFFSYDNKDEHTGDGFIGMKSSIKEFRYKKSYSHDAYGKTCKDCVNWREEIENKCWCCACSFNNNEENYKLNGNLCDLCATGFNRNMSKVEEIEKEEVIVNEYKYIDDEKKKHLHTYCDKPLLGTSTVVGIIAKPLTWWAAGLAVEKFGWMNKGNAKKGWTPKEVRLARAGEYQDIISKLPVELYQELLDDAYAAHSKKLDSSAKEGTDLHAELERYVKFKMGYETNPEFDPKIMPFIVWCDENVEKFLWSEAHCYSSKLWVGGISDCGVELKNGAVGIIDFKSSKESYESQFIQCAGYDIQLSENGGLNSHGYKMFEIEKPITFYAIVPFGAEEFTVDFRYNVDELKEAFESAVVLYKIHNK